jgi:hypothetical protein
MGFTMNSVLHGSLDWDVGLETVAKIRRAYFRPKEDNQGDLPRTEGFAEGRSEGSAIRDDRVSLHERREQPLPGIGPWQDVLDRILAPNEAKPSRERLTLIRVSAGSITMAATTRCDVMPRFGSAIGWRPLLLRSFRSFSPRVKRISSTGATRWC